VVKMRGLPYDTTKETIVSFFVDILAVNPDNVLVGTDGYCSPRHRMPFYSRSARHVIGCLLTQGTTIHHAFDDVASTMHQSPHADDARPQLGPLQRAGVRRVQDGG
jgi:hypothetical protein